MELIIFLSILGLGGIGIIAWALWDSYKEKHGKIPSPK
jgi:hypothetical protein